MRLIDADAFRRELDNHWPFTKEEQSKHGIADLAKGTVLTVLGQMPTIEERNKGEWMERKSKVKGLGDVYICPFCRYEVDCVKENFCPNCGADMRGEEHGVSK